MRLGLDRAVDGVVFVDRDIMVGSSINTAEVVMAIPDVDVDICQGVQ